MKYEKPEVTSLGSAVAKIHSIAKEPIAHVDSKDEESLSAYEADE